MDLDVVEWLASLKLEQYADAFLSNGFVPRPSEYARESVVCMQWLTVVLADRYDHIDSIKALDGESALAILLTLSISPLFTLLLLAVDHCKLCQNSRRSSMHFARTCS